MSGAEPPVGATSGSLAAVPPPPPQQQRQQEITAAQFSDAIREILRQQQESTTAQFSDAIREIIKQQQQQQGITAAARSQELRGWLMLVATVTASITFSAALNPPGGVWQDDDAAKGHVPGTSVFSNVFPRRFKAFYYFNFTSFMTSLCIIALSSTPALYNRIQRSLLSNLVTLDLVALAGAFLASSWTSLSQSVYSSALLAIGMLCFVCLKIWLAPRHLDIVHV